MINLQPKMNSLNNSPRPMNIAYLILTHNQPEHLQRMINALSYNENHFFIHVDKRASIAQFKDVHGPNVHFCNERVSCAWADYSLVQATLNLMKQAMDNGHDFDYFVLLSGACYPLKSNRYIESFLQASNGSEFIEAFEFPNETYDKKSIRLDTYWLRRTHPFRTLKCRLQSILLRTLPKRDYKTLMDGFTAYAGSQWWALTSNAVRYLLDYIARHEHYIRLYKSSDCPDESFFQTLLMNSSFKEKVSHKLVFTDWGQGEWSPRVITTEYLDAFRLPVVLDSQNNNCPNPKQEVLFARKFGEASSEMLETLDTMRNV